jgi:hypothetical protein
VRDYLFDARTGYYLTDMPTGWAWGEAELNPALHTIIRTDGLRLPNGEVVGQTRTEPLTLPGGIVIPAGVTPTVRPLRLRLFKLAQALNYSGQDNVFNDAALELCSEAEGIIPARFVNLRTGASYPTENDMWGSVSDGAWVLFQGWGDDGGRPLWAVRVFSVARREAEYKQVGSVEEATRWLATGTAQPPADPPPTVVVVPAKYINTRTGLEFPTEEAMWAAAQGGDGIVYVAPGGQAQAIRVLGVTARKAELHEAESKEAAEQWLADNGLTPRFVCLRTGTDIWSEDAVWATAQDGDGLVRFEVGPGGDQPILIWAFKVLDAAAKRASCAPAASMEAAEQYLADYDGSEKWSNLRSGIDFVLEDNMWADAEDGDGVFYCGAGTPTSRPMIAIRIVSAENREAEYHWVASREEAEQWLS